MSFPNYAGRDNVDSVLEKELQDAGIIVEKLPESLRKYRGEVKSIVLGSLHGWTFERYWRYWVCKGPGIEVEAAERLHALHGKEVRVDGHCGCPSPREWFHGLACGVYHVDTPNGLKALADTIRSLVEKSNAVQEMLALPRC